MKQNRLWKILIAIVLLLFLGFNLEGYFEKKDKQNNPPPGRMIDVGGYQMHLKCTGEGSPTVVIEGGWGDFSSAWGWVQPEVAKITRVCTYDRAGMGWSQPSPEPRMAREYAKELHTLLQNGNEAGPFVIVGHSMGGFTARVYAHDYPNEVNGMVIVDSQALPSADKSTQLAPKPGSNLGPAILARIGIIRLMAGQLGSIRNLPLQDKQAYKAYAVAPQFVKTFLDEGRGMSEGGAQAKAVTTLGDLPIIVLSRGKDQDTNWAASQAELLKLSTNSEQLFAENSGHEIMIEQPEAAIAAIVKMVEMVR